MFPLRSLIVLLSISLRPFSSQTGYSVTVGSGSAGALWDMRLSSAMEFQFPATNDD